MELIPDGTAVSISGFDDPETGEPLTRRGVILSGGHTVDGVPHYDVQVDDLPYSALIAAERITAE